MEKKFVLNSLISTGSYQDFITEIFSLVENKIPSYVCIANVHMVMEGHQDPAFQRIMNNANIATPDGKPLSVFLQLFENIKQDRVCGMDLLPDLFAHAATTGKSIYLYGSTNELLTTIVEKATKELPSLKVAGYYSPPFRTLTKEENENIITAIRATNPDLVFVALGCPKQERWCAENRDKLGVCLIGVGQAFNVYAGVEKRLPKWMRNLSLEWAYRLYLEPQRLWKRYLVTNSYFLFLTFNFAISRFIAKIRSSFTKTKHGRLISE
jgi:N-acetylglucosaminyldiphosphoundecaprenol N-acetyl-beta-D-mannosaminyltransferase